MYIRACWEPATFCRHYPDPISRRMLIGCSSGCWGDAGWKTTERPLKPVVCSMPISANLYVGFRAHAVPSRSKSAPMQLCWCWCALPAAIWSGTNQGWPVVRRHIERLRPLWNGYTCMPIDAHRHSPDPARDQRYYRQMASGLINEIRQFRRTQSFGVAAIVVNVARCQLGYCKRRCQCIGNKPIHV